MSKMLEALEAIKERRAILQQRDDAARVSRESGNRITVAWPEVKELDAAFTQLAKGDIDYLISRVEELEERILEWKRVEKLSASRGDELQAEVERLREENEKLEDRCSEGANTIVDWRK